MEVRGPSFGGTNFALPQHLFLSSIFFFSFFSSSVKIFLLFVLVGACLRQLHSFEKNSCSIRV